MFAAITTIALLAVSVLPSATLPLQQGRNSIEGRITTTDNKSLVNVRVFLLNDGYGQRAQVYTDGSGRFQFRNLGTGNYYIQVEPAGTGYERQTVRVEVNPYNPSGIGGAEIFRVDVVLKPEKPATKSDSPEELAPGADSLLFVQDVPAAAKEAYREATQSLKKEDLKAAEVSLTRAIEIFPDYYDALETLGSEYVKHAFYDSAEPLLAHAVEVNRNAWHSYYGLGVAQLELNKRTEGLEALRRAVALNPKSINASMRLGLELAKDDRFTDEAIKLLTVTTQIAGKRLPDAYLALASVYAKNQQYSQAADALEGYLQAFPSNNQKDNIKHKIEELRQKAAKDRTK